MERLSSAYLLAFIALVTVPASGQQTALPDSNTRTIAVVGDIENCDTYPVPMGTALTVRQAVINAGLVSESVNVTVIRSGQDHPHWTQSFSATSTDSGESVESGDVLVVQSMSPLTAAVRKNAALRSDFGVAVVSLEQDGIVIGDVLQATNTLQQAHGQLKVISRFSGQTPIAKAELYHPIAHGDVISISRSNRAVLQGFGSMSPAVSEWQSGGTTVARDPFMPNPLSMNNRSLASSQSMIQPLELPTSLKPSTVLPVQDEELPDADNGESGQAEEIPAAFVPALSVSQAEDVGDNGAADKVNLASKSMAVAPIAPSEMQMGAVTNPTATAFNPWNLVFMGGLLLAGTLILAGTLKPEPEADTKSSNSAPRMKTSDAGLVRAAPVSHRKWTESPRPQSVTMPVSHAAPVSRTTETLTKTEEAIRTDSAVRVPRALVAGDEWFSADWNGQNASTLADQSIPISETAPSASKHPGPVSEVESVKALSSHEQSFSELEDLLQNRLPIDLCESQLPLRVVLFGKPAGPKRLRIDAAHSAIPAPHMNLAPDRRRERAVAATNAAAAHPADTHTPSVAESSGSLDRALHLLQERTES